MIRSWVNPTLEHSNQNSQIYSSSYEKKSSKFEFVKESLPRNTFWATVLPYLDLSLLKPTEYAPFCCSPGSGYTRAQTSTVSPRGYGSNGSTPHSSNGSSYGSGTASINGYGTTAALPVPNHGNMGMLSGVSDCLSLPPVPPSHFTPSVIKSEGF